MPNSLSPPIPHRPHRRQSTNQMSWDFLPAELKHIIFKYKRLNHFNQRVETLSNLLQNRKASHQNGIINLYINKSRGNNVRPLRCLNSKCITITSNYTKVLYLCHLTKLAVLIESHELINNKYQSIINENWFNDLKRLQITANNFIAKSLYKTYL